MQISAKSIYFVTVISSFEGLQTVFRHFPDVTLIAAQVDTVLDADQRTRPGIGDFMQQFWNVHFDRPQCAVKSSKVQTTLLRTADLLK
ncbi:hypothetical protein JG688_00007637 [Phytophthora aleatoria]|uniref:Phosphoribosyltransferase domain-containing protein n=1 Tax=Phytophthora aleatoria TaxID=2496075 RepID=A0A8J5J7S0_9STRA|nr:hypothetical protein JG688_00007637 [Phytophthora aleatoria]